MNNIVMNNIFSTLMRRKDASVIREFVLWCVLCWEILLFLIAGIITGSKPTWIMTMVFTIGMAVLMVFRLTAIALPYSVAVFRLIAVIICYVCYRPRGSVLCMLLFVFLILLALGMLACSFIHNFSKYDLDKIVTILAIADSVFIILLQIMIYVRGQSIWGYLGSMLLGSGFRFQRYWFGVVCFWILLITLCLYHVFFTMGLIDNQDGKIMNKFPNLQVNVQAFERAVNPGASVNPGTPVNPGAPVNPGTPVNPGAPVNPGMPVNPAQAAPVGIQGINGIYAGQMMQLQNGEFRIGSSPAQGVNLVINDAYVSELHCVIRYNPGQGGNGFYEVLDSSANGVFLHNGAGIPKNVWNQLQRGSVICIGSMQQQFRLI